MTSRIELALNQVTFSYENHQILDRINFALTTGSFNSLIGPNASGKTTLLGCIAGNLTPDTGQIILSGKDSQLRQPKETAQLLAMVPQQFDMPFAFYVREIVAMGRIPHKRFLGRLSQSDNEAIDQAIELTNLSDLQGETLSHLSGGEKQRVALAIALAQEPNVLLLDEPTTHLDLSSQIDILSMVKDLCYAKGMTVLSVMHDINLASRYSDHILVLHKNRILHQGTALEVIAPNLLRDVFAVRSEVHMHDGYPTISLLSSYNSDIGTGQ